MSDTLLSHRINTLLLRANAPFPSEVQDAHDSVRKWREHQRLRLVGGSDRDPSDWDSHDPDTDPLEAA